MSIAGIEVRRWSLENIARLLQTQSGRIKLGIQRRVAADSEFERYDGTFEQPKIDQGQAGLRSATCYAKIQGETDDIHPIACAPANFGGGLPKFSHDEPALVLPVAIAPSPEYCSQSTGFNATGRAVLVTRWFDVRPRRE